MLIRRDVLDRILGGEVDLAFRRWKRPTVKAGGTLNTAVGVLAMDAVDVVDESAITVDEARRAGYTSVEVLRTDADAEAAIGGRSPDLVSPSTHQTRNVIAEAGGSTEAVLEMVDKRGHELANAMRERAAKVEGSDAATLFTGIADGLDEHLDALLRAAG